LTTTNDRGRVHRFQPARGAKTDIDGGIEVMTKRVLLSLLCVTVLGATPALSQDSGGGLFDGLFGGSSEAGTKTTVTEGQNSPTIDQAQRESYNGPKARIAVARFTNKARGNWYNRALGDGMADQLATALFNTNRYVVLERQALGDVMREQDLGASGRIRGNTAAPIGQIEGAELMIVGAVTEFQDNASGSRGNVGGGLGGMLGGDFGSIVGSIGSGVSRAHMAIDVRVIDSRTSRIVAATSVEGEATDVNMGGMLGGRYGGGALGGALSGWKNTPKEKALRMCIKKAVDFIVSKTPAVYMRHGAQQTAAAAPQQQMAPATAAPSAQSKNQRFAPGLVVRVTSASLKLRAKPKTGQVVANLPQGTPLLVRSQSGRWLEVEAKNGINGWVAVWLTRQDPGFAASNFASADGPDPIPVPAKAAAPQAPAAGGTGVKARLTKLKELLDGGLITQDEYNAKRKAILSEI
jgi:curli biogenesis system outer membrane secretion channel CsgG